MENMIRYGTGQIQLDPPRSDQEVQAAFLDNGCAKAEFVADGCCNGAITEGAPDNGQCCYVHCTGACCGRPLLVDGRAVVANAAVRNDWLAGANPEPTPATSWRDDVAKGWLDDALMEHASVASFSRFSMELLAVGAPADLVRGAHLAALDEVEHAKLCFSVAQHFGGEVMGPGPLDLRGATPGSDLAEMASAAVREGCVGETLASLMAREQLEGVRNAEARRALERIAEDEARHAELAWRFVAWAVASGGRRVRTAVQNAFRQELAKTEFPLIVEEWSEERVVAMHAGGRLTPTQQHHVETRSKQEVIAIAARNLLGSDSEVTVSVVA